MATYNFGLLELADGESGEAAVSVVIGKKKSEAAAAKLADVADPAEPAAYDKPKYSYFTKLQHDNGVRKCQQELKRLREVLIKLREEEIKLKEKKGNEGRINELFEKQRRLRQEQRKLRMDEAILVPQRKAFYEEHCIPLEEDERMKSGGSDFANADSGSNYDGISGNAYNNNDVGNCGSNDQVCDSGEHYSYGYDERQVERGHDNYSNGERQGNCQGQLRMKKVYVRKVKTSSNAGTEAEEKAENNVVSAKATEQKEANADNAFESNKSAGGAAQDGPNNQQGAGAGEKKFFRKERLNGSEKRKKKNAKKTIGNLSEKAKKQDSEADGSKKQAHKQRPEEEKKTLAEYERMCEEKKKSSEVPKTEVRKITAEEFKDLQMLEKKKLDDEETVMKAEKAQPIVKEASKKKGIVEAEGKEATIKDVKPKKVAVPHQNLGFRLSRRVSYDQKAVVQNGDGASTYAYNDGSNGAPRDDYSGPGRHDGYYGNSGYRQQQQQGGQQQRHPANERYYGEHRNSASLLDVENISKFPALPVASSARSAALASASAPAPAEASAPASA
ncbi:uncharacterized protein C2845_PM02G41730 [Panicum miliaceum]|uniref:Uncharacterized protein n=1 Tax=Panicum miliaceum TaxID=4540 RepID=A0A3L6SDB7_PANMI|nr:uncharacterized protein C2845_PM02G41730 [Panicum miliaceum]